MMDLDNARMHKPRRSVNNIYEMYLGILQE